MLFQKMTQFAVGIFNSYKGTASAATLCP